MYLFPPCDNTSWQDMGFASNLGYSFYGFYCSSTDYDLNEPLFRQAVIRTSWFLDFAHTYTNLLPQNYFGTNYLDELSIKLKFFVEPYYDSGMNDTYAIYLNNNYRNLFNTHHEVDNYVLEKLDPYYIKLFFNPSDLLGAELYNTVKTEFYAIATGGPTELILAGDWMRPYYGYKTPIGAEAITARFQILVHGALNGSELYTNIDLDNIYNLIVANEKVLWDFYLDPAGPGVPGYGVNVTKFAEEIGKFLFSEDQFGLGNITQNEADNYLKDGGAQDVITRLTRTFTNATSGSSDENLLLNITASYAPPVSADQYGKFEFNIKTASKYVWDS